VVIDLSFRRLFKSIFSAGLAAAFLLVAVPARAHDFWIEPSDFRPAPGTPVTFRLRVGQNFEGDPVPRDKAQIEKFFSVQGGQQEPVIGVDGRDPAGFANFKSSGLVTLGYRSLPHSIELPAQKFEDYLVLEGLEKIIAVRGARGEHAKNGKEQFSRCAKTLLAVGNSSQGDFQKPIGLTLELVPEKNPYLLKKGASLPIKLLYNGVGLEGALVVAMNRARPESKIKVRTDKSGRATLPLDRQGEWVIKAVQMIPAPAGSGADWESLWASLTFETGPKQGPSSLRALSYVFVDTDPASRQAIENAIAAALPKIHLVLRADEAEITVRYSAAGKGPSASGQVIKAGPAGKPLVAQTYNVPAAKDSPAAFAAWFIAQYSKDNS